MGIRALTEELKSLVVTEAPPSEELGFVKKALDKIGVPGQAKVGDRGWIDVMFHSPEAMKTFMDFAERHKWQVDRARGNQAIVYLARAN